jgi:hypothetical protein
MAVRRLERGSEFGRQVAVDFEADANLEKGGVVHAIVVSLSFLFIGILH